VGRERKREREREQKIKEWSKRVRKGLKMTNANTHIIVPLGAPHNKKNREQRTENKNFNLPESMYFTT